jgi:EmrB/QacA subfamily drug resistance transporter
VISTSRLPNLRDSSTWLLVLAGLGVFFAADDQTSVVAVLPSMINDIGLAQDQFFRAAWIVNGYILGYVVAMPLMGRFADAYGRGRVFSAALVLFCAGSAWVALSNGLTLLSIARAVQAVGGGAVVPVAMALVMQIASPGRRALGLGIMAAASEAGGLIGPLWGGGIAELMGWRAMFWINLPMCLPIAAAIWVLARREVAAPRQDLDLPGASLLGISLVALTIGLTDDPIEPRATLVTLGLFAVAALLFLAFLLREMHAPVPLLRLELFRRRRLSAAFAVNGLSGGTLIVAMVSVPLFTNVVLGQSALQGGINLMRLTVALPVGAVVGGAIAQRYGSNYGACLGFLFASAGFLLMSRWPEDPSFIVMTGPLLIAGFGFGLIIAPSNSAALDETIEDERATIASLLTVMRLLGALVGVALLTTRGLGSFYTQAGLIPLDDPRFRELVTGLQVGAFREVFLVTSGVCLLTILPAAFLGRTVHD